MLASARKQVANAIRSSYPNARVSWSGEARIITLHVMPQPGDAERILSIDSAYASSPERLALLIEDVLEYIS